MDIRLLTESDAAAFAALRLHGLQESPDAFGSTAEEFRRSTPEQIKERIFPVGDPPERFVLGAFDVAGVLVGMVGLRREDGRKSRHKAFMWGMYVAPEARGQGIGKLLVQDLLRRAAQVPGLEIINLAVVTTQTAARRLYTSCGFQVYGLEPHALKDGDRYADEELMLVSLV